MALFKSELLGELKELPKSTENMARVTTQKHLRETHTSSESPKLYLRKQFLCSTIDLPQS